jgi:hypothetical protein
MTPERRIELRLNGPGALYHSELIELLDEVDRLQTELVEARSVPVGYRNALYKVRTGQGVFYVERRKGGRWKCLFGQSVFWFEDTGAGQIIPAIRSYADEHFDGFVSIEELVS